MDVVNDDFILWYFKDQNAFFDSDGMLILNPFRYVAPGYIDLFLYGTRNMIVPRRDRPGEQCYLIREADEYDEEDVTQMTLYI